MFNRDKRDVDKLFSYAGNKMGISPESLKETVKTGNIDNLNIPEDKKQQIGEILGDREKLNKILNDPKVKALIDSITKGGR